MGSEETREAAARQAYEQAAAPADPHGQQDPAEDSADVVEDAPAEHDEDRVEQVTRQLAEAERERDEYLDALRRERAEFENFRKRTTKERMDALDRGAESLLVSLLSVLDNFGLALEAADSSGADDQLAKGVRMVHSELLAVLQAAGLEEVPGVGAEFDPTIHEAVAQAEATEEPGDEVVEPTVVDVFRPGYRFKGRVLRPASVKVAR